MVEERKETQKEEENEKKATTEKIEITEEKPLAEQGETSTIEEPIENIAKDEEELGKKIEMESVDIQEWKPKTSIGKKIKTGEINNIDQILDSGKRILESEIIDILLPNLESDLLLIGQSKGKFGGGQRRVFRQTQKKTREGNKPKFSTCAIVGDRSGHVGLGFGKAKETVPAREKAIRRAKLNIIKIRRGCGSWQCTCHEGHSIPFAVEGKCGSVRIKLMPAPKGKGLVIEKECAKMLALAGITDIISKTKGQTGTKINLIKACFNALEQLTKIKISSSDIPNLSIIEGGAKNE